MITTKKLVLGILFVGAFEHTANAMINTWVAELKACIESVERGKNFDIAMNVFLLRKRSQNPEIQFWVNKLEQALNAHRPINQLVHKKEPRFILEQREEMNTYMQYVFQGKFLDLAEQIACTRILSRNLLIKVAALKLFEALVAQNYAFDTAKKAAISYLNHDDREIKKAAEGLFAMFN